MKLYTSIYPPPHVPTDVSLSQFLNNYNPDAVSNEKVVLEDDWTGKRVTYGGLREDAARHAHGLREKYGLGAGHVVGICGTNSVCENERIMEEGN
jgi:acyl-coenzyme A synthetase/AMP-(fatty) acid ligase